MKMRMPLLVAAVLAFVACSSSDDGDKDSGPEPDVKAEIDQGDDKSVEPDAEGDQGEQTDQGADAAEPLGFTLVLEIWEMNEVASGQTMFDKNKQDGEEMMGLTFEDIADAGDGAIINTDYDAGWKAYGYHGPYTYYIISKTANDTAKLKEDTIAFIKHLAGKLPAPAADKVEAYVPADGEAAGWATDGELEAAYTDGEIEDIINGHHQPYADEGTAGFAKQDYKK